ncbi:MAG: thioredoxin family protein [Epsilonproteobacteria bacterium]|nr:thioredoxin family protein [Campylobacterota bacterium]NPA57076.1 thioredoxin family protein [Campylobacterota bacterium]
MRELFLSLLVTVSLLGADFDWYSYGEGLKVAKREGKPLMIMVTQKGCAMCDYMEEVAFEDEELVEFIENNYIPVRLLLEEARKLGYKAYGTPTFYFLDREGRRIGRPLAGAAPAKLFLKKLEEIKGGL